MTIAVAGLIAGIPARAAELQPLPRFLAETPAAADVAKPAAIRFVTSDDFPPFNFLDGSGRLGGYNVELARAICQRLGVPCTVQVRPFPLLVDALVENAADAVIAGLKDTPALRDYVIHTESYLRLPARFVVRREWTRAVTPEAMAGATVAVRAGTRTRDFLADFYPGARRTETASDEEAFRLLQAGEVDAVFTGGLGASFWLAGPESRTCCRFAPGAFTEPAYMGKGLTIAVAKENVGLKRLIDSTLRSLEADGTLADLHLRFFPVGLY
ncbi:transporter substrate-binding domain-containing protein [Chthonobacter rhizosphaerae]|uniref:transporter substrate-binding domain-containing protein n=1 Tax=Chthonobacter rhizosphaerae TaxID=2735553 RepID=UPI0015EFBBE0|nr:transporter substrate-binding domain-containing protein [Chthonobacter rhizosphaerae]